MTDFEKAPFDLIRKFHRFKLNAFPMPLPEGELLTLVLIGELNREKGAERTLVSTLAEEQQISVPTISRCLRRLEEKGLILKLESPADRRSTCVSLTDQGQRVLGEACRTVSAFIQKVFSHLEPEELRQFFITYDRIYEAFALEYEALAPASDQ